MEQESHILSMKKTDPFDGPEIHSIIPITQPQKEIWVSCQLGGKDANRAYNESVSTIFNGQVDLIAMQHSIKELVKRHESLRSAFSADGRFMIIFTNLEVFLNYLDLAELSQEEKNETVATYLRNDAEHIFDLVNGPLLKAGLIKLENNNYQFFLTAHHIICDGWSMGIMLQELGVLYSAYVQGEKPNLPKAEMFREYAMELETLAKSEQYQKIIDFWIQLYHKPIPQLDLPVDFPRPKLRTNKSQRLDFHLEKSLLLKIKNKGLESGCGLVTSLLTIFEILLYKITGQEELVVGLPAAGQPAAGRTQLVGHCVNLLPLRSRIDKELSFSNYLKIRKTGLLSAYEHQQLSFGQLLEKLSIPRDPSRVPLVPVVFNVDIGLDDGVNFKGLNYTLENSPRLYETFEIFLNLSGTKDDLVFQWSYNTSIFKATMIEQMMNCYKELAEKLVQQSDLPLQELINADNSHYDSLNNTPSFYPKETLHTLFEKQAAKTPQRTAVKFREVAISYKELNETSNQLAHYLLENNVQSGDLVGICIPRSTEMLIALLAVMKCGAAYVPMDPEYPQHRLDLMLNDSESKFVIIPKELAQSLSSPARQLLTENIFHSLNQYSKKNLNIQIPVQSRLYLLYTSGSTGIPKGVPISHQNLVNTLWSVSKEPGIEEDDKFMAITTISFDIATLELYLPLISGACVVMADNETVRDANRLSETLSREKITILQATPTTWRMLLDSNWEGNPQIKALCGGEALNQQLAGHLLKKCQSLWNMYGPTETTVWSAIKNIENTEQPISIGKPIANTQIYILNENQELLPPGKIGEIVIGGDGVASGYWHRNELTQEKFIPNNLNKKHKGLLYRTGDLGRLLPNGELECLGRIDQQIKIRGYRIEPGEIEQNLIEIEGIKNAVVLAENEKIIAFILPEEPITLDQKSQSINYRKELEKKLPSYFIPQEFRIIETFPTTPNGKIDKKALLNSKSETKEVKPELKTRTETENIILGIWKMHLETEEIEVSDNFFEIGGHSIMAVRIINQIERETGKQLPLTAMFEYPSIQKLAAIIEDEKDSVEGSSLVSIQPNGNKAPLYLIHGFGLDIQKFKDMVQYLDDDQPIYGLQGTGFSGAEAFMRNVEEIAAHYIHTITKDHPNGPYVFAGHSYGGIIAYEMTRQFIEKGEGKKVKLLAILDTYLEPCYYYSSEFGKFLADIRYMLAKKYSVLKEMSKSSQLFRFHLNRTKTNFIERHFNTDKGKSEQQLLEERHLMEIEKLSNTIMRRYHIKPLNIEIALFRANEHSFYMHDRIYLGWRDMALKGIQIYDVEGTHLNMFSPPYNIAFAKSLQQVLNNKEN